MKYLAKTILSVYLVLVGGFLLIQSSLLCEFLPVDGGVALVIISAAVFAFGIVCAILIDHTDGEYECPKCGSVFKPTLGEYVWGVHTLTKRRLKCHECGKKSFCKRKA